MILTSTPRRAWSCGVFGVLFEFSSVVAHLLTVALLVVAQRVLCFCAVRRWVAPRQKFTVRTRPGGGASSVHSVFHWKLVLYGASLRARRALNSRKQTAVSGPGRWRSAAAPSAAGCQGARSVGRRAYALSVAPSDSKSRPTVFQPYLSSIDY